MDFIESIAGFTKSTAVYDETTKALKSYGNRRRRLRRECGNALATTYEVKSGTKRIEALAFSKCTELATVYLPEGLESIGFMAFERCSNLKQICIPSSVVSIEGGAFNYCPSLGEINVDPENREYKSIGGVLFSKDGRTLLKYPMGKGTKEAYSIDNYMKFALDHPDRLAEFPEVSEEICGKRNMKSLAERIRQHSMALNEHCTAVYRVPEGVVNIAANAFYGCNGIEHLEFPVTLKEISKRAFKACYLLEEVQFPKNLAIIGDEAFADCHNLKTDKLNEGLREIGELAFNKCFNINRVTIPSSLEKICDNSFEGCSNLERINVSANNAMYSSQKGILFIKDGSELVLFPEKNPCRQLVVPVKTTKINVRQLRQNKALEHISVEEGNGEFSASNGALLSKDGRTLIYLPRGMKGTPSYEVPSGVTKIEDYAFEGCTIEKIVLPIGMEDVGLSAFFECRASSVVFKDGRKLPQEIEEYLEMERSISKAEYLQREIEKMDRMFL